MWNGIFSNFFRNSFSKFLAGGRCPKTPQFLAGGAKPPQIPPIKRSSAAFDRGGQTGPPRSLAHGRRRRPSSWRRVSEILWWTALIKFNWRIQSRHGHVRTDKRARMHTIQKELLVGNYFWKNSKFRALQPSQDESRGFGKASYILKLRNHKKEKCAVLHI